MEKTRHGLGRLCAVPHIVWSVLFIIAPLIFVVYYTFTTPDGGFTFDNIFALREHTGTFALSVSLSVIATFICFAVGYPLAYIIAQSGERAQKIMITLIMLPMWTNLLIRTYSMMAIMDDGGFLNTVLGYFNLGEVHLIGTKGAVIFGMVYDFLPFMVLPIYNVLVKIDDNTINAARDLGADYFQTLRKVILPLSFPGIASGIIMVFVPALTTFVVSDILGGGKLLLIGNLVENKVKADNINLGAGLSLILMIFIVLNMLFTAKYDKSEGGNVL